jgi:hypothetical protein
VTVSLSSKTFRAVLSVPSNEGVPRPENIPVFVLQRSTKQMRHKYLPKTHTSSTNVYRYHTCKCIVRTGTVSTGPLGVIGRIISTNRKPMQITEKSEMIDIRQNKDTFTNHYRYAFFQCCGSGSVGSVCFWTSWIRILLSSSKNCKKNFDSYCFVFAK